MVARIASVVKRLALGRWVRRNPIWHAAAVARFERLQTSPLEERRNWTRERYRRLLQGARRTRYGRQLGSTSAAEIPLLSSAEVRAEPDRFRLGSLLPVVPASTGGTSGIPLRLTRSLQSIAVEQAAIDFILARANIRAGRARIAILRGDDIKPIEDSSPPFWIDTQRGSQRIFSSNHLNRESFPAYADGLRRFDADAWWVYPTSLEALTRLAQTATHDLRVPVILASSEVLSRKARALAASEFGARVVDYYGQAERVAFAFSLAPGAYHFLAGYAYVELLPAEASEGRYLYEIVGTPLWNLAMPLLRYRTGDLIESDRPLSEEEREEIALGVRPFAGVLGREGDILIAPDGTRLTGIDHFQRDVDNVVRVQVIQDDTNVEIRVLPAAGYGPADEAKLLANARRKLPPSMLVRVRTVDVLERTSIGKTPFVIRRNVPRQPN